MNGEYGECPNRVMGGGWHLKRERQANGRIGEWRMRAWHFLATRRGRTPWLAAHIFRADFEVILNYCCKTINPELPASGLFTPNADKPGIETRTARIHKEEAHTESIGVGFCVVRTSPISPAPAPHATRLPCCSGANSACGASSCRYAPTRRQHGHQAPQRRGRRLRRCGDTHTPCTISLPP